MKSGRDAAVRASASVKIKESHELARPMVHLDRRHKLRQKFAAE
jgi:chromosome partitioning protein